MKTIICDFKRSSLGVIGEENEHNAIELLFNLPKDFEAADYVHVEFDTMDGDPFARDTFEFNKEEMTLRGRLDQKVMKAGELKIQLVGYAIDEEGTIDEIAKSPVIKAIVGNSVNGIITEGDADPSMIEILKAKLDKLLEEGINIEGGGALPVAYINDKGELCFELGSGITDAYINQQGELEIKVETEEGEKPLVLGKVKGRTPEFRLIDKILEIKYDDENTWSTLVDFSTIASSFDLRLNEETYFLEVKREVDGEWEVMVNLSALKLAHEHSNKDILDTITEDMLIGGIKSVSALPTVANEGDVVYYCPQPNRLTAADSGHKVYFNNAWVNDCPVLESRTLNRYILKKTENTACTLKFDKDEKEASITLSDVLGWNTIKNEFKLIEGVYSFASAESSGIVSDSRNRRYVPAQLESATLPEFDAFELASEEAPEYVYFYVLPRFYRYTNGEWVELPYSEPELSNEIDCELTDTTLTYGILPNILYRFGEVDRLNLDLLLPEDNKVDEYQFSFISGETATVLTLPDDVVWAGGKALEAVPNAQYTVTVLNGVASFETTAKDDIWTAIDEIRGGIDEIEAMIDESEVLE